MDENEMHGCDAAPGGADRTPRPGDALPAHVRVVAVVSHDLKNPLSVIRTATDYLLAEGVSGDAGGRRGREQLMLISRSVEWMDRLVNDLLDAAAIQAGQLRVEPRRLAVEVIVADATALLRPLAADRRITLVVDAPPGLSPVAADRERILQVFSNLGGNAVKFGPVGGQVEIAARAVSGAVEFRVRDDGPGIAPEDLPHVFEPFWRAPGARSGIGLGLAIVRAIVEAHGGCIRVASQPGVGTTLGFTLPAAPDPAG